MKLKKIILGITLFTTAVSSSGITALAAESTDGGTFRTDIMDAYVYKLSNVQQLECRFYDNLPSIPYVKLSDYYKLWTDQNVEIVNNKNGTYSVRVPYGNTGVFDVDKNYISVDSSEFYLPESAFSNTSIYADNYLKYDKGEEAIPPQKTDIDLDKYHISIYGDEEDIWLPVPTLCDIFTTDDKETFYMDDDLYFCGDRGSDFSIMLTESEEHFNNYIEQYRNGRPEDLAEYNYNELCLSVDITYGFPRDIPYVSILSEKGLDAMLSEGSDGTRKIRELLLSTDLAAYSLGIYYLGGLFDDGGHTYFDPLGLFSPEIGPIAYDLSISLGQPLGTEEEMDEYYVNVNNSLMGAGKALEAMMGSADRVVDMSEGSYYFEKGDTAVFGFSLFEPDVEKWYSYYHEDGEMPQDVLTDFQKALVMADENPEIKKFVIDLGMNLGGLSYAVEYMIGLISDNNTSFFKVYGSDEPFIINYTVDTNFDKVIDEKDASFHPDLQYAVLISNGSLSCANWFASIAHDNNILLIGEQSGGLSCASVARTTADGLFYVISSSPSLIDRSGNSIEFGVKPDYEWVKTDKDGNKDFSDVYNFENIGKAIDEFYGNVKDDKTGTETVTTTAASSAGTDTTTTATTTQSTTSAAAQSTSAASSKTTDSTASAAVTTTAADNTDQDSTSELPQTGNNSVKTLAAVAVTITLIVGGSAAAYASGIGRNKKREEN